MFFSGMSGLHCTPAVGCVGAGAARPAVKGIVKEMPVFGFWVTWFTDSLSFSLSSLPSFLPSAIFCVCLLARGSEHRTEESRS